MVPLTPEVGDGLPKSTVEKTISTDYMPLRCLRRSHILDINVDPSALGEDKTKQEVVPVTEIDEWLELFMIYSAVRARRFPMEGHQLISYMKHVKTIAQRKGSDVAIEYDGQVRVKGNVHRSPFEQVDGVKTRSVFVLPSTKATVHD